MKSRILPTGLVFILIISTLLSGTANAHRQPASFQQTAIQGEIAYGKDGDLWLLDLFTGESQQLTADGDNRWPVWSPDGRYLLYTHGDPEAQADLYLLEIGQDAPSLLAENACCGAWRLDQARIAYLNLADTELSIETIQPDGANKMTIIPAVQVGRSSTPTGNLLWLPATESAGNTDQFVVPLQVIGGAGGGLTRSEDVFGLATTGGAPIALYGETATCFRRNYTVVKAGGSLLEAVAFTGSGGCGGEAQYDKGILLTKDAQVDRELPWLAYPAFSPDGKVLTAERYGEAADPASAELAGIVLHNLADDSEQMVAPGGAQPTWRPGSNVDPVVARYLQPGERAIAIQSALTWQGATYQVHYLTTSSYRKQDAGLFTPPTPAFFADQGITALIVTKDGQVVTDAATLRQLFLRYTAAYYLYEQPPAEFVPGVREELGNVLNNPIFQALSVGELLRTPRAQTAETLRAMLTDQVSEQTTLGPLFDQAFATTPQSAEAALDAFSGVVENQAAHDAVLLALKPDLAAAYANLGDTVKGSKYELQLLRLALQLLFTSHLQAERADWLETYAGAFIDGAGSLDRTQLNAAADVLAEVQSSNQQRIDIATDFMAQMSAQTLLDLSGAAAAKAASQLLAQMGEKFGVRLASNAVAGTLAAVSVGASLGNLLYGSDELFANFTLAQRADELRTTFQAGRAALQEKASFEKAKAPDTLVYDGDLAAEFRAAYLLETLAAVQTQRAYADGAAATIQLPNPLQLVNWLRGQDWKVIVAKLHQRANEIEATLLDELGTPRYLETAITLALNRAPKGPTVIVGTPNEPDLPKLHPEWTSYTNANFVNDLLLDSDNNAFWAATRGGVVRWDMQATEYVKLTNEYGLVENNVRTITQSADGAFWIGANEEGVSRLGTDGQWTTFTIQNGLASNKVTDILQSTDGTMWFATNDGVSRLDGNAHWTTFTRDHGLAGNSITTIAQGIDGSLWFGTYGGVSRLDVGGHWTTFTQDDGLASNSVMTILQSVDGSMWFGTAGDGVSRLDVGGHWTTFTQDDGLASNFINTIAQSTDRSLWFGTSSGLSRLDIKNQWTTFVIDDRFEDNYITSIHQSHDSAIWVGTNRGIRQLGPNNDWTTFSTQDGLADNLVTSILRSTDNSLWFGTDVGISKLDTSGRWIRITIPNSFSEHITDIAQSSDGSLWFGTWIGAYRLNTAGIWTTFTVDDGLVSSGILSILPSADGALWFGTQEGVSRLDPHNHWTTFTENGLADFALVLPMIQTDDGDLWFGTGKGISRLDSSGNWISLTTADGLLDSFVCGFAQSNDGSIWVGTGKGVSRLDSNGAWSNFTVVDGLADDVVCIIFQSKDGTLWFGTDNGVSRLGIDGTWSTFRRNDGLAGNVVLSITQSPDGALWFGTIGGVSRLDGETVGRNTLGK